jgi:hypothetical protein
MVTAFPRRKDRKHLTPAAQEKILSRREAIETLGADVVAEQTRRLRRVRIGLERIACSSEWVDANWHGAHMLVKEAGKQVCRHVSAPYPPGGDETLMLPCKSRTCQGRLYPPNYMTSSGHCTDCQERRLNVRRRKMGIPETPRTSVFVDEAAMKAANQRGQSYRGSI